MVRVTSNLEPSTSHLLPNSSRSFKSIVNKKSFLSIESLSKYYQLIVRVLPWIINNLIEQLS